MAREKPRERKPVSAKRAALLPYLGFRYSISRDGYILRGIGNRVGPVYQVQRVMRERAAQAAPVKPAESGIEPEPSSD